MGYLHTKGKMHRDIKVSYLFYFVLFSLSLRFVQVRPILMCNMQTLCKHRQIINIIFLQKQCCRGVNWCHRKSVAGDVLIRKHVTNGVTYSGFWGRAEVDQARCMHTDWSLSLMCYHRRSGLDLLSLLSPTQRALPVSSTLTAGCHQGDCQSQPTETMSVELSKCCETGAALLAVRSVTDQQ